MMVRPATWAGLILVTLSVAGNAMAGPTPEEERVDNACDAWISTLTDARAGQAECSGGADCSGSGQAMKTLVFTQPGHSWCTGEPDCLTGGTIVRIVIIASHTQICTGGEIVCSGNVALTVEVIGSHNRICSARSDAPSAVVCTGNVHIQWTGLLGTDNTFCTVSS